MLKGGKLVDGRTCAIADLGLTPERREQALALYRQCGVYTRVAAAMEVSTDALRDWRRQHPDFQAELDEASREYNLEVGQLARTRLWQHLAEDVGTMQVVEERETHDSQGNPYTEVKRERIGLNAALARTALTKLDPAWTHPAQKQEVEVRVSLLDLFRAEKEEPILVGRGDGSEG